MVTKVCYKCKRELSLDLFCCNKARKDGRADACKECKRQDDKKYQERNKITIRVKQHKNYVRNRKVVIARSSLWARNNKVAHSLKGVKARRKLKLETFSRYCDGDIVCKWCGKEREIDLLTIDHIEGGGNKHRKKEGLSGAGYNFYRWLKRNNFPDGYQVLCWNCNYKKRKQEMSPSNPTKRQLQKATDDGAKHRRALGVRGFNFYIWLRKNGFPQDSPLQVLCLSCQYRKRNEEGKSRPAVDNQGTADTLCGV